MSQGQIIGEYYRIDSLIGQGGMGAVYRGVDSRTQTVVAIKELRPELVKAGGDSVSRFEREAEALRKLNHPNIVKVLASFNEGDRHYIVMEYVGGGALEDVLQETPQLPVNRVLEIALDLADALTRAHRLKIIHRDIKPANVLLREDDSPLLTDFGVARIGNTTRMTADGAVVGTLAYLPPEALRSEPVDERLDIWAFGVMLYEMLAGVHPFKATSAGALLNNILMNPIPDLFDYRGDVPWTLMGLVYWMLEKDPLDRPSSVRLIGAMLENIMSGTVISSDWFGESGKVSPETEGYRPNREEAIRAVMNYTTTAFRLDTQRANTPTPTDAAALAELGLTPITTASAAPPPSGIPTGVTTAEVSRTSVTLPALPQRRFPVWMVGGFALALAGLVLLVLIVQPKPAVQPDLTSLATVTQNIMIDPVSANERMTIIAQFERISGEERDVTRFVADNLRSALEEDTPYSDIRIRVYPEVIRDAETARQIAIDNGAEVIVWGSYDTEGVTAQIQLGSLAKYPYIVFPREEVEKLTDVRSNMTSERRETLAYNVLAMYNALASMNGDTFAIGRNLLILRSLDDPAAVIQGNGVAARFHRFVLYYVDDPTQSIAELTEAIRLDADNPMLYAARALAYQRLGDMDEARIDTGTAERFAGKEWSTALLLHVTDSFFTTGDYVAAFGYLDRLVAQRPDDWYPLAFRGIARYMLKDYAGADADLHASIDLNPQINFPYTFAIATSMRRADVLEVQRLFNEVLNKFPDPSLAENILMVSLSPAAAENPLVPMSSAFGNVTLQRWEDVITDTQASIDMNLEIAEPYLFRGMAYCNLGQYEEAEESYDRALEIDDSFGLVYLLRAEVRQEQGDLLGAGSDVTKALTYPELQRLQSMMSVDAMQKINCTTFVDTDWRMLIQTPETTSETE